MPERFLNQLKDDFDQAIEHLKSELAKIHTGRASSALVEELSVDYYGARTPLKSLALISVTAPRELKIEVWDQKAVKAVEEALSKTSLGSVPQVEGKIIRLNLPPVTGESRQKMIKAIDELLEKTRISLRTYREKIWSEIQKLEREGEIREDDKFKLKDKIQEMIDEYNNKIEELGGQKEEELKI